MAGWSVGWLADWLACSLPGSSGSESASGTGELIECFTFTCPQSDKWQHSTILDNFCSKSIETNDN